MKNLLATLHDYDPGMLPALADVWGVDAKRFNDQQLIEALHARMMDESAAQAVWDKLDEKAQGALRLLAGSLDGRITSSQFAFMGNGKIRKLGRAQIARLRPHIDSDSIADSLYYRGLIGEAHDNTASGIISFVYAPEELAACLPLDKTSYDDLEDAPVAPAGETQPPEILDDVPDDAWQRADATIVDDMTSLLALLQADENALDGGQFPSDSLAKIAPILLRREADRLTFLLGMGISARLIELDEDKAAPRRQEARQWLAATRSQQIKALADAWRSSQSWRDLWHIDGLTPDDSGWAYDAAAARQSLLDLLKATLPAKGWVSLSELIDYIKATQPDFQRPDGDYDSWYIRNDDGEFLRGRDSWDAVEGALIEHVIGKPMHWLGLVDAGDDLLRLTAYGRAFLGHESWPPIPDQATPFDAQDDGALLVSRRTSRFERFQLARFAKCVAAGDPYIYSIDGASVERAESQGISRQQIQTFLTNQLAGKQLPLPVIKLLREWDGRAKTSVTLESQIVLRTTSEEEMQRIFTFPAYRRYLGARLGPMACVVRADQWQQLQTRLEEDTIEVDVSRMDTLNG